MKKSFLGSGFMYGMNLQKAMSPVSRHTVLFHDEKMVVLMVIAFLVGGSLSLLWLKPFKSYDFMDHKVLEVGWTMMPVMVLVVLALPSLELLYYMDSPSSITPLATLKAMGRQWYWSYEMSVLSNSEVNSYTYDSYMLPTGEDPKKLSKFRLLEVDNPMFIPRGEYIRLLVTGGDVMHSFCIPSMGMKVDAVPGRLNQSYFLPLNLGSYYGQCSEMCGANHSFMPMNMEMITYKAFRKFF